MTQNNVVERERGSWAVREVRECECCWCTTVLVEEDHVGESRGLCGLDEVAENEISSIQADGSWEEQADLLCEGGEAG